MSVLWESSYADSLGFVPHSRFIPIRATAVFLRTGSRSLRSRGIPCMTAAVTGERGEFKLSGPHMLAQPAAQVSPVCDRRKDSFRAAQCNPPHGSTRVHLSPYRRIRPRVDLALRRHHHQANSRRSHNFQLAFCVQQPCGASHQPFDLCMFFALSSPLS